MISSNHPQATSMTVVQKEQLKIAMAKQERQIVQSITSTRANTPAVDRTQMQDAQEKGLIRALYTAYITKLFDGLHIK